MTNIFSSTFLSPKSPIMPASQRRQTYPGNTPAKQARKADPWKIFNKPHRINTLSKSPGIKQKPKIKNTHPTETKLEITTQTPNLGYLNISRETQLITIKTGHLYWSPAILWGQALSILTYLKPWNPRKRPNNRLYEDNMTLEKDANKSLKETQKKTSNARNKIKLCKTRIWR